GAVPVPLLLERLLQPAAVRGQQPRELDAGGGPDPADDPVARGAVESPDGRRPAVHHPGDHRLLLRPEGVRRRGHAHRGQGVTAAPRERLGIALLGTGWVMDFPARAVLEHPGAELVAAANWREPSLHRLAERYGIPRVTTDWRALAADPEVDAVVVATPNAPPPPQGLPFLESARAVR